ncbi:MAG TPA: CarD family transcriptional regulator, partial [Acetobacteraceae bacterium]|nr:CarD family transcriptional regulator [Acetobacteraceae bacterium]
MSLLTVYGAPEGFDAALIARRAGETAGGVVHAARDDARLARLAEAIGFFAPEIEVLRFPAWDCLPYDRVSPNGSVVAERVATLCRLIEAPRGPFVVLTTVNAAVQRVPPRDVFAAASLRLTAGGAVEPGRLLGFLDAHGYHRAGTVMEAGDYAVRGGIIDVFPAGEPAPVRIDLFGDTIESMRRFDPDTQRSSSPVSELMFRPASEVPLDAESISRFRTGYREMFGPDAARDPLYVSLSEGRRHPGMEHYLPLFTGAMDTLFDYLPGASVSLDYQAEDAARLRFELIEDHEAARRAPPRPGDLPYRPVPRARLYLDDASLGAVLAHRPGFAFSPFARPEDAAGVEAGGRPGAILTQGAAGASVFDEFRGMAQRWQGSGRRVILAAWSAGSRERLAALLREHAMPSFPVASAAEARATPGNTILLAVLGLERGFIADDLVVVAEQDLLGARIARPPRRRSRADQFIADATEIAEGDLVVHQDHGIGRYDGLVTLAVDSAPHDCLRIIYDGDGKLFLPVENIELLSRFGQETAGVALDKLGGASWQARKARAKNRIQDMAAGLIRIAAERKLRDASLLTPEPGVFDEFCARFPYTETEDQARAIADVLEDLASGKPMDRLICGDVGFGKTEVALRAAFVAAMSGTQVAVVVPTTLLARQHFRLFAERFAGLPVKVAQLSRLVTAKEAGAVRAGLADGSVNIVVGTHALLAKSV